MTRIDPDLLLRAAESGNREDTGPLPHDAVLPGVRKRGQAGDPRVAYFEWSPQWGADHADPLVWAECNPALGSRIRPQFLADQLSQPESE